VRPPSTGSSAPFTKLARSVARKTIAFRNLVGSCRTPDRSLGCKGFTHAFGAFRTCAARGDSVQTDAAWSIFCCPCFRKKVYCCLTRSVLPHPRGSIMRNHRRYVNNCSVSPVRHQWSKFSNEKIWRLHVYRKDLVKILLIG
jgi:hypothetical protein